jgi:hypothetical protein
MRLKTASKSGGQIRPHNFRDQRIQGLPEDWDFRHSPAHNVLLSSGMHLAIHEIQKTTGNLTRAVPAPAIPDYASEEIYGYVAARDALLIEAEQEPTETAVKRARMANEFVINCLRPLRVPYGGQFLAEPDATRELQRCREASARLTALNNR